MADTRQVVRWSLGGKGSPDGHFWLPYGPESLDDVLREAIGRLRLEARMRSAFQVTDPLWYGLWIDSPLTSAQCGLLKALLTEAARLVPRYGEPVEEFVGALTESLETGAQLHVELMPPGHVDLGWVTTFAHCPRCKAEAPVERWTEDVPVDSLECPVCGFSYVPAETRSSERDLFAETVTCRSCGAEYPVRDFSEEQIQALEDRHTLETLRDELSWLRRVEAFYQRHPDLEGRIKPTAQLLLESTDPAVWDALMSGIPVGEIALPSAEQPAELTGDLSAEDEAVIGYLRENSFLLSARKPGVEEMIERLETDVQGPTVACPACGGDLGSDEES